MLNKSLVLVVLSIFAAGCGMEAHTYTVTKERVGFNQVGNAGCITGQCPQVQVPAPAEKTRKIYVLEITQPVPESEVQKIERNAVSAITEPTETPSASGPASLQESAQPSSEAVPQNEGNLQPKTYTVQKDDTLQKISKKLYGTYGRWYKIYQANKDKIKNPNFVRPGTVLIIPALK